jgi:hypothetical protein
VSLFFSGPKLFIKGPKVGPYKDTRKRHRGLRGLRVLHIYSEERERERGKRKLMHNFPSFFSRSLRFSNYRRKRASLAALAAPNIKKRPADVQRSDFQAEMWRLPAGS